MATLSGRPGRVTAILAISFLALAAGRLPADDKAKPATETNADADKDLRKRALELNNITGTGPVQGEIVTLVKDEKKTKLLLATAVRMAKEKDQPFNVNATYILAATAHLLKDVDTAKTFYRINIDQAVRVNSEQKKVRAYGGLIQLLFYNQKYADCEKVCNEVLDLEGDDLDTFKHNVLHRLILTLARQGQFDKAHERIDNLIKATNEGWLHWSDLELKGDIYREQGKPAESAKLYEDVLGQVKGDEEAGKKFKKEQEEYIRELQYKLSGVYVDANQVDKAAANLTALLEKDPDNPTFNNDLGYIWADHDKNLVESEKLIRKALEEDRKQRRKGNPDLKPEEDKDNAAFLDSLGWVLFKQKKYKEAKPELMKAVELEEGKHIEIYDHLGDVCMALGEKAEAISAWKKGIEVAGKTQREQQRKAEVEKKLKANP
jgi:tetratricopeptide (TPR) repeat protein